MVSELYTPGARFLAERCQDDLIVPAAVLDGPDSTRERLSRLVWVLFRLPKTSSGSTEEFGVLFVLIIKDSTKRYTVDILSKRGPKFVPSRSRGMEYRFQRS